MRKISFPLLALFAAAIVLSACSDSENNTENPSTETSRAIGFSIDLSQDWKTQQPGTRAVMERSPMRNLQMSSSDGSQCKLDR